MHRVPKLAGLMMSFASFSASAQTDVAKYIAQRGGKVADVKMAVHSPSPEIAPVIFYEKDHAVPSCGLVTVAPRTREFSFIELVGSDPGAGFPQCLNILSMTPFRLQDRSYLSVEYLSRETREDIYRSFHYVYRDSMRGYVADEKLNDAAPPVEVTLAASSPSAATALEGVKRARMAFWKQTVARGHLKERDFIADKNVSFATFEDKPSGQCRFGIEAGGAPLLAAATDFAADATCVAVLAASRLVRPKATYYLTLFGTGAGRQLVAVMSASADGRIAIEQALAEELVRRGATTDIKTAKGALEKLLP
jgi:hypothetical protein